MPERRQIGRGRPSAASARVLRVFRYRPVRGAFDGILRDVMLPDLARLRGLEVVFVGRQGPDELGERVAASIWSTEQEMIDAVGASFDRPVFHPELMVETSDKRLDVGPVVCSVASASASDEPAHVVRLLFGRTKPGRFEDYVEAAARGAREDLDRGHGPLELHVGALGDDRFVTLSTWAEWSTIADATAGTVAHPSATRHAELLAEWRVHHYEAVPDVPSRPGPTGASGTQPSSAVSPPR